MKIINPKALATPRSTFCEYCSHYCCRALTERHHIVSRGMGGGSRLDVSENLIDLGGPFDCGCHDRAQAGAISKEKLFDKVARRMGRSLQAIMCKVYRLRRADKVPAKRANPKRSKAQDPLKGSGRVKRKLP